MARTIGVKYKNMIKKIVARELQNPNAGMRIVFETVKRELPVEAFETWESAYNEIERLTGDLITAHVYAR